MLPFLYLLLLLISALFFGKVAEKLGQTAIVGNILGGIVAGPLLIALLGLMPFSGLDQVTRDLHPENVEEKVFFLMDFAIVMLMFASGLEMRVKDFIASFNTGILTASLGVIVPFTLGFVCSYLYLGDIMVSLYVGAALSITAVALSITTLIQMDAIHTRFGMTIVNAAIVDDIIGIIMLSVLLSVSQTGNFPNPFMVGGMVVLAVVFVALSLYVMPGLFKKVYTGVHDMRISENVGFTILIAGLMAVVAHLIGLHLMIGAFLGGMAVRSSLNQRARKALERWAFGFFGPVFFAWVGFSITFSGLAISAFLPMILLIAFVGKLLGSGLGARLSGLSWSESSLVGIGMNGKAAVELILAAVALRAGIIDRDLYSAVVIMAATLAITTPLLLRSLSRYYLRRGWLGMQSHF